MATINNPTEINNNTPNAGTEIEERIETLYQNDLSLNSELVNKDKIITGTGFVPTGTFVKMSYFEGTTDGSGICTVAHGLGSNVISFIAEIFNSESNVWQNYLINNNSGTLTGAKYYDDTNLVISCNLSLFFSQPVRFLVFHK